MNIRHIAATALTTMAMAVASIPAAAHAQPASRTADSAVTTVSPAPTARENQRVCVRVEATGTNVRPLVCRTRSDWIETEGFVPGERPSSR